MLLWRIAADCLPEKEKIGKFSEFPDDMCWLCSSEKESALHILTKCPLTKALWFCCQWGIRLHDFNFISITDFVKFLLNPPSDPYMGINGMIFYNLVQLCVIKCGT